MSLSRYISNMEHAITAKDHELRERLADQCHEQWSHWMKYLFSKTMEGDAETIIPEELVKRWKRQMSTPFAELSQEEQDSDRREADKFLALLSEGSK